MPVDVQKGVVFIHIPKTGGTSIERMFGLNKEENLFSYSPLADYVPANRSPQHFTVRELKQNLPLLLFKTRNGQDYFGAELLKRRNVFGTVVRLSLERAARKFMQKAFKFAFTRNPWDRFLSEYSWRRRWYFDPRNSGRTYYYSEANMADLDAFVGVLELPREKRLDATMGFDAHLETQLSFITDERGEIRFDLLGRFEAFEQDVRVAASKCGIYLGELLHVTKSVREKDYRHYFSSYARSAVESFYREDIKAFDYKF